MMAKKKYMENMAHFEIGQYFSYMHNSSLLCSFVKWVQYKYNTKLAQQIIFWPSVALLARCHKIPHKFYILWFMLWPRIPFIKRHRLVPCHCSLGAKYLHKAARLFHICTQKLSQIMGWILLRTWLTKYVNVYEEIAKRAEALLWL